MTSNPYDSDSDIPVLDDLVSVDTSKGEVGKTKIAAPAQPGAADGNHAQKFSFELPAVSKPLPRNNPFLPYEHLEQLARERVEFQKQFTEFTLSQMAYRAGSDEVQKPSSTYQAASSQPFTGRQNTLLDNLARQLTQEVVSELRPQIEKRIHALLQERFGGTPESVQPES